MPGSQAARPREQVIAARIVGGLALLTVLVVAVVLATTGGDTDRLVSAESEGAASVRSTASGGADDVARSDGDAAGSDGSDHEATDSDSDAAGSDGEAASSVGGRSADRDAAGSAEDTASDDADEGEGDDDPEPVTVEFDGVCSVEIAPDELAERPRLRPWEFSQCRWAPIAFDDEEAWWIVVVESLSDEDFNADEALARAAEHDRADQLLYSSHYPSLNPDLWVVFAGPFRSEDSATASARRHGGDAYPRRLSDDEGDRYCVADDGCVGETRD